MNKDLDKYKLKAQNVKLNCYYDSSSDNFIVFTNPQLVNEGLAGGLVLAPNIDYNSSENRSKWIHSNLPYCVNDFLNNDDIRSIIGLKFKNKKHETIYTVCQVLIDCNNNNNDLVGLQVVYRDQDDILYFARNLTEFLTKFEIILDNSDSENKPNTKRARRTSELQHNDNWGEN